MAIAFDQINDTMKIISGSKGDLNLAFLPAAFNIDLRLEEITQFGDFGRSRPDIGRLTLSLILLVPKLKRDDFFRGTNRKTFCHNPLSQRFHLFGGW